VTSERLAAIHGKKACLHAKKRLPPPERLLSARLLEAGLREGKRHSKQAAFLRPG
jgi:hypothetical protein